MIIKIRIYRRHDLDLIGLFANDEFPFEESVANALRAYTRQENIKIKMPETHFYTKTVNPKSQINIYLDNEEDADVIQLISSIPLGNRNSFIKCVFRNMLEAPYWQAFTGEIHFTNSNKTVKEENKKNLMI